MAVRSKRVSDPLDERVKDRIIRGYKAETAYASSGSEHSATTSQINDYNDDDSSSHSLSYLLHCFDEENSINNAINDNEDELNETHTNHNDSDSDSDSDMKNEEIISALRNLNVDIFRNILYQNVTKAYEFFRGLNPNPSHNIQILNRNIMLSLQKLGYNAAICKTKWQTTGGLTSGSHEFIDVIQSTTSNRYFIDLNFAGEFNIARPTNQFQRYLQNMPVVFVGKHVDLKVIVKLMSDEIRRSLKTRGLLLPPWRKNRFMQNKWFGPYRRTVNYVPGNVLSSLSVPLEEITVAVKCSMIGFSVVDSVPLFNAATRTR